MSGESLSGISSVNKTGEVQKQEGISVGATLIKRGTDKTGNQTDTSSVTKPPIETKTETQKDLDTAFESKKTPISKSKVEDLQLVKDGLSKLEKSPLSTITPESLQLGKEGLKHVDLKQSKIDLNATPIPKTPSEKTGEKISSEIHKDTDMLFGKKSELFKNFATKEFSNENVDFMLKLDDICKKPTLEKLQSLHGDIKDLNISNNALKSVDDAMKTGNVSKILDSMSDVIKDVKGNLSDTNGRFKLSPESKLFDQKELISNLKDSLTNIPQNQNKDKSIKDFLFNPNKSPAFEKFVIKDQSAEDFRFLTSVNKALDKPSINTGDLANIYANYLDPKAPARLNIDSNGQKLVDSFKNNIQNGNINDALKNLDGLIKQSQVNISDPFSRFVSTPECKEAIKLDAKNNILKGFELSKDNKFAPNNLLFDPKVSPTFENYAKKEWSSENIGCQKNIKDILSNDKLSENDKMAQLKPIYEKFIKTGSESEVNISDKERTALKTALDKGDFTETLKAIKPITEQLTKNINDTYSRFTVSTEFKDFIKNTELKHIEKLPLRKQLSALDDSMKEGGSIATVARDMKNKLLEKYTPKMPIEDTGKMGNFIKDFKTATYHFKTSVFGGQIDKVYKSLDNINGSGDVKSKLEALDDSIKEVQNFMKTRGAESSKSQWVEALGGRLEEAKKGLLDKYSTTKEGKDYFMEGGLTDGLSKVTIDPKNFDKSVSEMKQQAMDLVKKSDPKGEFVWSIITSKQNDSSSDGMNNVKNFVSNQYPNLKPDQQEKLSKEIYSGLLDGLPNKRNSDGNSFTVDGKNYKVIKQLGEGGMGLAFLIENQETGQKLVAKGFKSEDAFYEEVDAHRIATGKPEHEHQNVSKFIGATMGSDGKGWAFQEFVNGKDLLSIQDTIKKFTDGGILSNQDSNIVKQYLAKQMIDGMAHVNETRDMIHMDIKPENFMFDKTTGSVKVIDFGSAQKNEGAELRGVTPGYIAPELSARNVNKVSDIWSVGLTIQELTTGSKVFTGFDGDIKATKFAQSGEKLRQVKDTKGQKIGAEPTAIGKVINNMVNGKPEDRMKFSELAKQPYFTDPLGSEERAKMLLTKMLDIMSMETPTIKKDTLWDDKKDFVKSEFQKGFDKIPR